MPTNTAPLKSRRARSHDLSLFLGLGVVLIFFIGGGLVAHRNTNFLVNDAAQVAHTHEVIQALNEVLALVKDAETSQRGFLITYDEKYLEPFTTARSKIDEQIDLAERLTADNPTQQALLKPIRTHIGAKLAELDETIRLRRTDSFDAARALVITDRGKSEMDALRSKIAEMDQVENDLRQKRIAEMQSAYRSSIIGSILTAVLGIALSIVVAYLIRRTFDIQRRQEWLQAGSLGLSAAMFGEQRVDQLGQNILAFLVRYFDAHAGVFFTRDGGSFKKVAEQGIQTGKTTLDRFSEGNGLLGQAAKENSTIIVNDIPDGYLTIGSGLGQSKPRQLIISTASSDNVVNAVLEFGFIHPLDEVSLELLKQVSEPIGVAVKSAVYRENLQELLEETQRQAEELQTQSEELRVSNEELEEQSRVLKESQMRLEQQQAELEQTNSQLEEQAQQLEIQRDDLSRTKLAVQAKAEELERASRYKSDFLANMSHELRTPLNSSLILSKLLSDNPLGNLTEEQVKYAQTIQSSGNDLLALINDILDLSKIEAGHMEIHPEHIPISRLISDMTSVFEPVARQKGLQFSTSVAEDCPDFITTDRQRLEQVLKNLLANAMKFTEQGRVALQVRRGDGGRFIFAVSDTGIGISTEHQQAIFEAFRQADGTISRRYGGTGLGLSISRELVRLLGGTIQLESVLQKGSTFIVILPANYTANDVLPPEPDFAPADTNVPAIVNEAPPSTPKEVFFFQDDRDELKPNARTILVVEDDESFARIIYNMVHEFDFRCLVANTAESALSMAKRYLPNAVLLDIGLPDNSGLSVLDRLKNDMRTRHIPVHVISATDHSKTALSLGAIGYMLKPVKRAELLDILKQIETRFAGGTRQVLIVEDDVTQQDSLIKLLSSENVNTVAVGTATECLEKLKEATFDCMVLDLSLPDATGYSLLETLSKGDIYSFPPVIVYTGRDLSYDDEQKLRRYSKSIIIKGAKSPERLLDEVTLFLHRVVAELPPEQQKMLRVAHNRDAVLEGRRILVVEDDVRNVYSMTNIFEPLGAVVEIARNGREALTTLEKSLENPAANIDIVLMDVMMPEMDGLTATREIRKRPEWKTLPIIMLTAKAMKDDQEKCLNAGANDYMAKPLDVEKLLSLVRVWMPR